ncbi:MAG: YceI family protein [Actinomycetota bacterium]|nr:YceI family protein [Actinomycetota bacterium]
MSTTPIIDRAQRSAAATRWRLDPTGSNAEFRVRHFWGLVTVKGHFDRLDGWLEVDRSGRRGIELNIDATSVRTRNPMRDRHLRGADFFDAERSPEVHFHSTSVSDVGEGALAVTGELAAAGHRVALDLQPRIEQTGDELQIDVSILLDQRELGMSWSPLGMTLTPVTLHVHALLRRER